MSAIWTLPASSGSASSAEESETTFCGTDQSIEWSARTITIERSQRPDDLSASTNRPTWVSVDGERRAAGGLEPERPGEVAVPDPVDVAEVDEHQVRVDLVEHRQRGLHRELVGRVPGDRHDRLRLPPGGRALAEDAVEVLLAEHRAGPVAGPVEPLDDGLDLDVASGGPCRARRRAPGRRSSWPARPSGPGARRSSSSRGWGWSPSPAARTPAGSAGRRPAAPAGWASAPRRSRRAGSRRRPGRRRGAWGGVACACRCDGVRRRARSRAARRRPRPRGPYAARR